MTVVQDLAMGATGATATEDDRAPATSTRALVIILIVHSNDAVNDMSRLPFFYLSLSFSAHDIHCALYATMTVCEKVPRFVLNGWN